MSRPRPRAPRRCRPQVRASQPPPAEPVCPEEPPTATGQSELPPGDPAALGRLCQPGPSPGGLRDIRSGPVSGIGLTRRGRLGARRASAGTGPLLRGQRGWGGTGSLGRAPCGAEAGGTRRGERIARVPAAEDRGSRVQREGLELAVCLRLGAERTQCATCLCRDPGQHLAATAGFERQAGNGGQPGSTAGKGVPRQMGEPLSIPNAKRTVIQVLPLSAYSERKYL